MIRDIKEIRAEITRTDDEMAKLFEKRMQLASQVAAYKKSNSLPIYDAKREEEVLRNGAARISDLEIPIITTFKRK